MPTSLNRLWFSVVGALKVDYLDFPCEIFEILCELKVYVGEIACNFFGFFWFFPNFFCSTSFSLTENRTVCIFHSIFATKLKFSLSILILEQKACFLGPTVNEIPQQNSYLLVSSNWKLWKWKSFHLRESCYFCKPEKQQMSVFLIHLISLNRL